MVPVANVVAVIVGTPVEVLDPKIPILSSGSEAIQLDSEVLPLLMHLDVGMRISTQLVRGKSDILCRLRGLHPASTDPHMRNETHDHISA